MKIKHIRCSLNVHASTNNNTRHAIDRSSPKHKSISKSLKHDWSTERNPNGIAIEILCPRGSNSYYTCPRVPGCLEPQNPNRPSDNGTNHKIASMVLDLMSHDSTITLVTFLPYP